MFENSFFFYSSLPQDIWSINQPTSPLQEIRKLKVFRTVYMCIMWFFAFCQKCSLKFRNKVYDCSSLAHACTVESRQCALISFIHPS